MPKVTINQHVLDIAPGTTILDAARQAGIKIPTLCFLAGANSIFYGERLLTTENPEFNQDDALFDRLGLRGV